MSSLLDVKIQTIRLDSSTYELISKAGEGGSSYVYKARPIDGADYCVIKEFFPHSFVKRREADGSVVFNPETRETEARMKARVMRESDIVDKLRHDDKNKNNNPWFLGYSKPIPANNTLYTIIQTESGETLYERILLGYYKDKDFVQICDCMLEILKAIEPIHENGYLHLDISPDNIFCSNVMRMIDYNSAYSLTGAHEAFFPSFKEGYSAPELRKANAQAKLGPAADIFSLAAVFFSLLINSQLKEMNRTVLSRWLFTSGEGRFKGASKLLVDEINEFFRKNLANSPALRLKSVAEMREKIEALKELAQKITLINSPKRPSSHFICREDEIEKIDERLQTSGYVILEGMGGIGKTELAKSYAWDSQDKYDVIQFASYSGDLRTTIAHSLEFRGFDSLKAAEYERKYGSEAIKYIFRDKMAILKRENGGNTLIVVDNYNAAADDHFDEFISGDYKIIFTSREKHGGSFIEITEMKSEGDLLALFREYYEAPLPGGLESVVMDIIRLVLGHTMTVMLIATAMRKSGIAPDEMLARLQKGLDPKLRTKIAVEKEEISAKDREDVVYGHIRSLFNMEDIIANENYAFIMTNMAIVPYGGMAKETFYDWALYERYKSDEYDDKDYTDLNWLIDRRWVQEDDRDGTPHVSLHPVVSDLAYRELKPDSVKCAKLIEGIIADVGKLLEAEFEYDKNLAALELMKLAATRIDDETELARKLCVFCAIVNALLLRLDDAFSFAKQALAITEKLYGDDSVEFAETILLLYKPDASGDDYDYVLSQHDKALEILIKCYGERHWSVAMVYNRIGYFKVLQEELKEAERYLKKSVEICKTRRHKTQYLAALTEAYQFLYWLCICADKKDLAETFKNRILDLLGIAADAEPNYAKWSSAAFSSVSSALTSSVGEPVEKLHEALKTNRKLFGEKNVLTAMAYHALGSRYMDMGLEDSVGLIPAKLERLPDNILKAYGYFENALTALDGLSDSTSKALVGSIFSDWFFKCFIIDHKTSCKCIERWAEIDGDSLKRFLDVLYDTQHDKMNEAQKSDREPEVLRLAFRLLAFALFAKDTFFEEPALEMLFCFNQIGVAAKFSGYPKLAEPLLSRAYTIAAKSPDIPAEIKELYIPIIESAWRSNDFDEFISGVNLYDLGPR